mgnify:FL=1
MRKTKKMRSETKAFLVGGLIILLAWGLYINYIYGQSVDNDMDTERSCSLMPPIAGTKNCNNEVYTNFGGGLT